MLELKTSLQSLAGGLLLLLAGCQPTKTTDNPEPGIDLLGAWDVVRDSQDMYRQGYEFFDDGAFTHTSIYTDTNVYEGKYALVDSMLRLVTWKNGMPIEEVWARIFYGRDSMTLYKGILLEGGPNSLAGTWRYVSDLTDSLGNRNTYECIFASDGILIQTGPGGFRDTLEYSVDSLIINVTSKSSGDVKRLGYDLHGKKLALYNLDAEMKMTRNK